MRSVLVAIATCLCVILVPRHRFVSERAALRRQLVVFKHKQPRPGVAQAFAYASVGVSPTYLLGLGSAPNSVRLIPRTKGPDPPDMAPPCRTSFNSKSKMCDRADLGFDCFQALAAKLAAFQNPLS